MGLERGRGLTSVVYFILTNGCRLVLCQVQNVDLIAVSLACPKDLKSLYSVYRIWGLIVSSVRNLPEKVGDLRDIAVLVHSNLTFLTFTDLHLHSQIVSDYHPLFLILGLYFL